MCVFVICKMSFTFTEIKELFSDIDIYFIWLCGALQHINSN